MSLEGGKKKQQEEEQYTRREMLKGAGGALALFGAVAYGGHKIEEAILEKEKPLETEELTTVLRKSVETSQNPPTVVPPGHMRPGISIPSSKRQHFFLHLEISGKEQRVRVPKRTYDMYEEGSSVKVKYIPETGPRGFRLLEIGGE